MLTYSLDRTSSTSLYEQLYLAIRRDIESGAIAPGAKLPSKRSMASHLDVSLITIEGALSQLIAEGYVCAKVRKGYFAASIEGSSAKTGSKLERAFPQKRSPDGRRYAGGHQNPAEGTYALNHQNTDGKAYTPDHQNPAEGATSPYEQKPATSANVKNLCSNDFIADLRGPNTSTGSFPYKKWTSITRKILAEESESSLLDASQPQGSPRLRRAIADHLHGFRGLDIDPERIVIGAGAQVLYQLIVQLLGTHSTIALEELGYPKLQLIYEAMGARTCPIPVIANDSSIEQVCKVKANAIHCMPSHHFPTGNAISAPLRYRLIEWAREKQNRYIIEDDYDCEFRLKGKPLAPMASIDDERVIYLNTYTKSLGGAFRIGYMVLPQELICLFREKLGFYSSTVGGMDQASLALFIENGSYERHCNRMRTKYRKICQSLSQALIEEMGVENIELSHVGAGLHFTMRVRGLENAADEARFVKECENFGVKISPLGEYAYRTKNANEQTDLFIQSGNRMQLSCEDRDGKTINGTFLISISAVLQEDVQDIARILANAAAKAAS